MFSFGHVLPSLGAHSLVKALNIEMADKMDDWPQFATSPAGIGRAFGETPFDLTTFTVQTF